MCVGTEKQEGSGQRECSRSEVWRSIVSDVKPEKPELVYSISVFGHLLCGGSVLETVKGEKDRHGSGLQEMGMRTKHRSSQMVVYLEIF